MIDAITIGETMLLLDPVDDGHLDYVSGYRQRVAGAESNFAIALGRLGLRAAWVSRLGADPFGRLIRRCVASEGVEVHAGEDPDAPTGIYFKERSSPDAVGVYYYRTGSAASRLRPEDVPEDLVRQARLLHFTGISLAVKGTLANATLYARGSGERRPPGAPSNRCCTTWTSFSQVKTRSRSSPARPTNGASSQSSAVARSG